MVPFQGTFVHCQGCQISGQSSSDCEILWKGLSGRKAWGSSTTLKHWNTQSNRIDLMSAGKKRVTTWFFGKGPNRFTMGVGSLDLYPFGIKWLAQNPFSIGCFIECHKVGMANKKGERSGLDALIIWEYSRDYCRNCSWFMIHYTIITWYDMNNMFAHVYFKCPERTQW